ncbi:hypothetical protein EDD37DRAFT_61855 [Exophiala viscosa]|uniref:Ubiquitin 3 binding protein But2 C-terminal domain-containing protein n=1 Tax=Exophiala viscosa TaxID=2486360 RepID=A0AAN6E216_9EURO|nr:hypothetical protein EDD36DRAFT_146095 [Exophiala viscosa]KAI1629659.1 hypothetical protein EDD37DRAFT_61855 [Exophiala viscosa]
MKQIFSTATLFLASLAAASPISLTTRATSITISIKTGDGDSATTLTVPLDQITQTSGQSTKAVAASISTLNTFCQAFSDSAGTTPLGPVFSSGNDASYSASSSGDTASQADDAVTVAAYLCSATQAGVAPKTSTTTGTGTTSLKPSTGTITVELEQSSDQFVQTDIPLDYSLVATTATTLGNMGIDLSLVSLTGSSATLAQVGCQVFEDAQGTVPVGGVATSGSDAILAANPIAPSHIQSIRCGVVG